MDLLPFAGFAASENGCDHEGCFKDSPLLYMEIGFSLGGEGFALPGSHVPAVSGLSPAPKDGVAT